jgi:Txe/YoeB family toxin of Txe-Axe toxin-antitoxin module
MSAIAKVAKCSYSQYYCEKCDYRTSKKFNYDKHILTSKHLESINDNNFNSKSSKSSKPIFICQNCSKEYKDNSGLWRHKKKCNIICNEEQPNNNSNECADKELIMLIIKDNSEFKNMMMEQQTIMMEIIKNGTHNTNTNSLNKTFNLQFFLNETCKNAMNIMEFVESIQLQLSDLEKVGEQGYVEGISNIIINNLKGLDVTQRPIHCTDKKREVLYVKDEDLWQKEDQQNDKIRTAVKKISDKNMKLIPQFQKMHPDCNKSTSKIADKYNTIIYESMGGKGDNINEKENKIITNISKQVMVEKES